MDDKMHPIMSGKPPRKISIPKATKAATFIISFFVVGYAIGVLLAKKKPLPLDYYLKKIEQGWEWFFIAICLFLIIILAEIFRFIILIYITRKQFRPVLAFRTAIIGRFYNAVTPYTNGGQGIQSQVLSEAGFNRATALSVPFSQVFFKTVVFNIMLLFFIIFNNEEVTDFKFFAYIGLVINCFFPILFVVFSINERLTKAIMAWVLKVFQKLRIVKNYEYIFSKVSVFLEDLSISARKILRDAKYFVLIILLYSIEFMALMSLPYFLFRAIGATVSYSYMIISYIYIYLAMTYVPIPGAAGAYELSFLTMYAGLSTSDLNYWVMITMRIFTYFFYIIMGYLIQAIDAINKYVKRRKEIKRLIFEHLDKKEFEEEKEVIA